eukprot:CAMPEP_0177639798 /NCGR_PEP_ID=MMETSP0447-20121125/6210_1 /TAXON_ID=0 /ORGANISM="Stygamoeba regulata, Strain BSH-02190019" /LENGTH=338 /DNA_ID=CAMNT_0019141843 /DNA_START=76 /DNA_END=1092 /DNA_ORIENTATION=-
MSTTSTTASSKTGEAQIWLLCVDTSEESDSAFAHVQRLASSARGDRVLLLFVCSSADVPLHEFSLLAAEADVGTPKFMAEYQRRLQDSGLHAEINVRVEDDPRDVIVKAADACHADFIVMGSRGRGGLARMLLGSTSTYVLNHSTCPTIIVRSHGEPKEGPLRWLVALDGSEESENALQCALRLAGEGDEFVLTCTMVHQSQIPGVQTPAPQDAEDLVFGDSGAKMHNREHTTAYLKRLTESIVGTVLDSMMATVPVPERSWQEERPLPLLAGKFKCSFVVRDGGDPRDEILSLAKEREVDIVAMGGRGRSGLTRALLGSTSDYVVRNAHLPVLISRI